LYGIVRVVIWVGVTRFCRVFFLFSWLYLSWIGFLRDSEVEFSMRWNGDDINKPSSCKSTSTIIHTSSHDCININYNQKFLIIYSRTYNQTFHFTLAVFPQRIRTTFPKHGKVRCSNDNLSSLECNINTILRSSPRS
jgi:hypothetical protein